jgi:uncharacterized protein (TIGR02147 family)
MSSKKSVYEYDNYREFLKDFYLFSKAQKKSFSFRYFARVAGFSSPSTLKRVIAGERNLTLKSIEKFSAAIKLNKEEAQFFKNLVLFNQATTADEKHFHAKQILRSHKYKKIHPISEAQFNYFSHWYMVAVRELVTLPLFREDPDWIASQVRPEIKPEEAKKAVDELLKLGLLQRNPQGKLIATTANVSTADEVASKIVAHFHREMMNRAMDSVDTVSRENREISALAMGVSEKTMKAVKERIQLFREELVSLVSQDECPNMVYQLNFQFFPLTQIIKEGKDN